MKAMRLGLCAMVLLVGCSTVPPEKVETQVYRHGFDAVQRTNIPPDWTGQGLTVTTTCPWAQLAKFSGDGKYYCPTNNDTQELRSLRHPISITGNYASMVIPAAGQAASGAFMGLGFGLGASHIPPSNVSQSVTGTQAVKTNFESPGAVIK